MKTEHGRSGHEVVTSIVPIRVFHPALRIDGLLRLPPPCARPATRYILVRYHRAGNGRICLRVCIVGDASQQVPQAVGDDRTWKYGIPVFCCYLFVTITSNIV